MALIVPFMRLGEVVLREKHLPLSPVSLKDIIFNHPGACTQPPVRPTTDKQIPCNHAPPLCIAGLGLVALSTPKVEWSSNAILHGKVSWQLETA